MVGTGNLDLVATQVDQLDLRPHHLGGTTAFRIDHNQGRQTSDFVHLAGHGQAFLDVLELGLTSELGDDGAGQRIPVGEDGASLDHLVRLDSEHRAVRHLVALTLATMFVMDDDFARAGDHHQFFLAVGHIAHGRVEPDAAIRLGFDTGGDGRAGRSATDVEGAHGQLGAGLADGLRRNHTHSFTTVDQTTATQVAAIALGADAETGFTGQGRADLDFVNPGRLQRLEHVLVQHHAGTGQHGAVFGMQHLFGSDPTQHSVAQRLDDLAAFDDGAHERTVVRAAILLGDHQILGHIDQTARQVARVGRLERGVSQAFSGAVGGDKVLQHVQAFAEVRGNGGLDDGAIRLGHQAAHAGHLANLGGRAACTRVGHHVDGVKGLLRHQIPVAVGHHLLGQLGHHHLGDFVARLAPDVHHFVVTLASGNQTGHILLFDLLDLFLGAKDDFGLFRRHQHVVDTDGNTCTGGQAEAGLQQLVCKHHRLLEAALAEGHVDQLGDFLFLECLVDVGKRQTLGQDLRQQGTASRCFPQLGGADELTGLLVFGVLGQPHVDAGIEFNFTRIESALHFTGV